MRLLSYPFVVCRHIMIVSEISLCTVAQAPTPPSPQCHPANRWESFRPCSISWITGKYNDVLCMGMINIPRLNTEYLGFC
jgi:hypothetical protein